MIAHVIACFIGYAAFAIAFGISIMYLFKIRDAEGNSVLMERFPAPNVLEELNHQMVMLGFLFLSVGIITGAVWANSAWGRYWGWDPKETWALIADLGFIAILHARYIGWLKDFGLLLCSTIAFLLVILAWYGVNFILAAGLHSYGFSSGGATMVSVYVGFQFIVLIVASLRKKDFLKTES